MELERRVSGLTWREGFSCHLVALLGTTLSSLAGEGNKRFLGGDLGCFSGRSGSIIPD